MNQTLVNKVKRQKRRGSIVVLAAVMLVVVIAFMAFSIDYGYIVVAESDLQNAADAGALSGARALKDGRVAAVTAAKAWAGKHLAAGENVIVADEDVEIGKWDDDTATFTPLSADSDESPNAVRVTCRRTAANGNPLLLFFAPILGTQHAELQPSAVAAAKMTCGGFVGILEANVNSGFTDSYDSRKGSYASQFPGNEGHVCSNYGIGVKAPVKGNASPGTGYAVSLQGAGSVSGSTDSHAPKTYRPAAAGNAASSNQNNLISDNFWDRGKLKLSVGDSVTFPGGTIYATDVSINGELIIAGPTTLYIERAAVIAGQGIVNATQYPASLTIVLLDGSGAISTFAGGADLYANIYGPGAEVTVAGNAGFYGSIVASRLKFTNSGGCHFDEASKRDLKSSDGVALVQ